MSWWHSNQLSYAPIPEKMGNKQGDSINVKTPLKQFVFYKKSELYEQSLQGSQTGSCKLALPKAPAL